MAIENQINQSIHQNHLLKNNPDPQAAPGDWNNEPEVGMTGEAPAAAAAGAEGAAAEGADAGKVDDWAAQSTQAQKETGDWGENVEGSW